MKREAAERRRKRRWYVQRRRDPAFVAYRKRLAKDYRMRMKLEPPDVLHLLRKEEYID